MAKNYEKAIPLEKFCPNCGAPVNPEKGNCVYCGVLLPGITAKLSQEQDARNSREFKRDLVNDVLGFVEREREKSNQRRLRLEEKNRRVGIVFSVVFLCLCVAFFIYMFSK